MTSSYRGRFAPSPTGPLHFGSILAALASYVDARHAAGKWFLRIEDVDRRRTVPGAADEQLRLLERYGFEWDAPVLVQSKRVAQYRDAVQELLDAGYAFPCACSRAEVATRADRSGPEGPIYAGTCRNGIRPGRRPRSVRLEVGTAAVSFADRIAGRQTQSLADDVGDFVIRRADGFHAYHLACVVDDADQGISHIVRGGDLLSSTPRQVHLQGLLGYDTPAYAHIPLAVDETGRKLSKQYAAAPVHSDNGLATLVAAWRFLNQCPVPTDITGIDEFWPWAITHWRIDDVVYSGSMKIS